MKTIKIAVVGAGSVGSTIAYSLVINNIAGEIILIDKDKNRCKGQVLDLNDSLNFSSTAKIVASSIESAKNTDIIIIAAGQRQKPNQTRQDLLNNNKKVIKSIMQKLTPLNKNTILIIVTNPVDTITYYAQQISQIPYHQIIGSGTFLDTQRLKNFLSQKLNISQKSINAFVIGEHGDSQFPIWSSASIAGTLIENFPKITKDILNKIEENTKKKAYDIIACKGSTYFGIASCVTSICKSIIYNQKRIIPVSVYIKNLKTYISMPSIIGCNGVEKIINLPLNEKEKEKLKQSAQVIISAL